MIVAVAAGADGEGLAPVAGAAGAGLVPLRWADAAVVAVVCDPTQDVVSLVLDGAAVVVVSEPTRDVSLALDGDAAGPEPMPLGST